MPDTDLIARLRAHLDDDERLAGSVGVRPDAAARATRDGGRLVEEGVWLVISWDDAQLIPPEVGSVEIRADSDSPSKLGLEGITGHE